MTVDTLSLVSKVAIITGSARENGIGAGIARALAHNGVAVIVNYVSESSGPRADNVVKDIQADGGKAKAVRTHVSNLEEANKLVAETLKAFGTENIDILGLIWKLIADMPQLNNAGAGYPNTTLDIPVKDIENLFQVNVLGILYLTRAGNSNMGKGGRIVNITSGGSKLGMTALPIYGATKTAIDSLTFTWAEEFGLSRGITVNSVALGLIVTDLVPADDVEALFFDLLDLTRVERRFSFPVDIVDIVLLVVREKSRWLTGQYISASEGITG